MSKPKFSDLEWQLMSVIWEFDKPVSVREVIDKAYPNKEKAYTTVQTVMNNLVEKKFLKRRKIGLLNIYRPAEKKQTIVKQEVQKFLSKTFSGSLNAMVSFLINSKDISKEELDDLKKLISENERSG